MDEYQRISREEAVWEMKFDDYQRQAKETAVYPNRMGLMYTALGLAGEAGEVANKVKKVIRDEDGVLSDEKRLEIADELGDVLWYAAAMATELGWRLEAVADYNIKKLLQRKSQEVLKGSGDKR